MTIACAPGKIILVGEHAVVYGRPAVAVPVSQVQAEALVEDGQKGQGIIIVAADLGLTLALNEWDSDRAPHPLEMTVVGVLKHLGLSLEQNLTIKVRSTIPIARGLGSGAAVSTAIVRAVAQHLSEELTPEEVSTLVFEVERLHHGTPSGIDNTVVAHERPVYFLRGEVPETFRVRKALSLVIADTGVASPTKEVVDAVREARRRDRGRYDDLFDRIAAVAVEVRRAMEKGDLETVGLMMAKNHRLLQEMDVSSPLLDSLVDAARRRGALGAKLSGAGRGGNMIALVSTGTRDGVRRALASAGAQRVIQTEVLPETGSLPRLASNGAPANTEGGMI